jgi:hypothetical protein
MVSAKEMSLKPREKLVVPQEWSSDHSIEFKLNASIEGWRANPHKETVADSWSWLAAMASAASHILG